MATVRSTSNSGGLTALSTTIPKPAGLSVGDFMIALIEGGSSALSINTASGWTLATSNPFTRGASCIQYKIATASDLLATGFTFTSTASNIGGGIICLDGSVSTFTLDAAITSSYTGVAVSTINFTQTLSPSSPNDVLVMITSGRVNNVGGSTMSGYTSSDGTLTWAEVFDQTADAGTVDPVGAGAYALQSAQAIITSYGSTASSTFAEWNGILAFFKEATPLCTASTITNVGLKSATATSSITSDQGSVVTARGFVYDTNINPTISNSKTTEVGTIGSFSSIITGLTANTTYYIRSYATNSFGTSYGTQTSFTTSNVISTELVKDISAIEGATYAVSIDMTGTLGSVTVQLGRSGTSAVFTATGGTQTMQGTYSGTDGLIITRSGTFNGTIDNVMWVRVLGTGTLDWTKTTYTTVFPISSEVYFKRIEDDTFNSYRMYRFLDLLFKDFDGYVTVTIKEEKNDAVVSKVKTFLVGNATTPASPFSKKRISFLCKDQAIIIGVSNASVNETFAIAKFVLGGNKLPRRMFSSDRIISMG